MKRIELLYARIGGRVVFYGAEFTAPVTQSITDLLRRLNVDAIHAPPHVSLVRGRLLFFVEE